MDISLSQAEGINVLREAGYISDFELFGRELLCLQQKVFIREADYLVSDCYRVSNDEQFDPAILLLGIISINSNVKGILINSYCNHLRRRPPVIIKKLAEYYTRYMESNITAVHKGYYFKSEFLKV